MVGREVLAVWRRQAGVRPKLRMRVAAAATGAMEKVSAVEGVRDVSIQDDTVIDVQESAPGVAERLGALARAEGWTIVELSREP